MQTDLRQLSKQVRDETGVELEQVRKYVRFMFREVSGVMERKKYESVGLQYLGTFWVKPGRLAKLKAKGVPVGAYGDKIVEAYENSRKL